MKTFPKTYTVYKRIGQTPLEAIQQLRKDKNIPKEIKMCFAGRLDPLAEGKLLILVGDECKKRDKYLGLDKEYEFEILFDAGSDTQDVLGLVHTTAHISVLAKRDVEHSAATFVGRYECQYPAFSSKTVNGKQLFLWALEGKINEIDIPSKMVNIYELKVLDMERKNRQEILEHVLEKINSITPVKDQNKALGNDFRRSEIRTQWRKQFDKNDGREFAIVKMRCIASSGAYMRTLARDIAWQMSTDGLAWSIKRTKIGKYKKILGRGVWIKKF